MVDSAPDKPIVFRNVELSVRCTCRKNNGFRKDCRPISKGQLKEVLFRSGDPVDGARTNQSDSEYQRLCRRTGSQLLTRETSGQPEIVLNSCAASRLPAWYERIERDGVESFGGTIHSRREPCRSGADDGEVINMLGREFLEEPEF